MTFNITGVEVISGAVGAVIGYKLKTQIANTITAIKKAIAGFLTPKP